MDSKLRKMAILASMAVILLVALLVMYVNREQFTAASGPPASGTQNAGAGDSASPAENGVQAEETVSPDGQIGNDLKAFLKDNTFFDQEVNPILEAAKDNSNRLSLVATSIEKDLRIQIVDNEGTCLQVNRQRAPAYDAPASSSNAAFSLVDHSTCTPCARPSACSFATVSMSSDDGVPGYPATTRTPASSAACANASLPIRSFLVISRPPSPALRLRLAIIYQEGARAIPRLPLCADSSAGFTRWKREGVARSSSPPEDVRPMEP